jgi:hypothetical protein
MRADLTDPTTSCGQSRFQTSVVVEYLHTYNGDFVNLLTVSNRAEITCPLPPVQRR